MDDWEKENDMVVLIKMMTQAPFTPYLTENIYQTLKQFIPKNDNVADDRSVHFLDFPTVREEYFDPEIERAVGRMQAVIELGRTIREKKNISLKVGNVAIDHTIIIICVP